MKKFEIWTADLNPRFGTEPGKIRPVVIVQTDLLNNIHDSTLVCPVSTNLKPYSKYLRVHLKAPQSVLSQNSEIMIDQIRAIDNRRFKKKIGKVPENFRRQLEENLKIILDLL